MLQRFLNIQPVRRVVDQGFVLWSRQRMAQLDRLDIRRSQILTLDRLIRRATATTFGRQHDFGRIRSPEDFHRLVPLRRYEAFHREYFGTFPRMENVLWPGVMPSFALRSGATEGSAQYLPITREMLRSNRKAALTTLAAFLSTHPKTRLFLGKMLLLSERANFVKLAENIYAGDLGGIAMQNISPWIRPFIYPSPETALRANRNEELDRLVQESVRLPISMISGAPSWLLLLFARLKKQAGAKTVAQAWPQLRCVVHASERSAAHRQLLETELGDPRITLQECDLRSEGFIAFEDPRYELLRLIPDHDIYFEFVPVAELERAQPTRHGLWEVVPGVQYAVVLTTCAGLWAYIGGDTICFERTNPHLFRFTGGTHFPLTEKETAGHQ
jgi:hypothetical protein